MEILPKSTKFAFTTYFTLLYNMEVLQNNFKDNLR